VTSVNPLSKDVEDETDEDVQELEREIEEMKGEHSNCIDRMFPFGPTCAFNGIKVLTFFICSKNGSITSQLLNNMLQRMDDLLLFDRSDGGNHFLLCNGHGSRFEEPFLEYTLKYYRPWTCCRGVPYVTSV
jgi:hypothetical protein